MSQSRRKSSIAANPVLIGAVTTLVLVVLVFLAYNANSGLPFVRTDKGGAGKARRRTDFHAFWEAVLSVLLIGGAVILVETNIKEVREINIFAGVLVIQSLPFVAAVAIALLERSRLNDFATWRAIETQFGELIGRRPARIAEAVAPATVTVMEKQTELAQ